MTDHLATFVAAAAAAGTLAASSSSPTQAATTAPTQRATIPPAQGTSGPLARAGSAAGRLPDTDDGLAGAGTIRRGEWFHELWEGRHAEWAARGSQDQGAVVFVGDSITQDWGDHLDASFSGLKVANRGISGDTTRGVLIRIADVVALHPRAVVILAGTNDLEEQDEPETVAGNMKLILEALETGHPGTPIVLCEVFPSSATLKRPRDRIAAVNRLYAELARTHPRVMLLRSWGLFADEEGDAKPSEFPDLLHPNRAGYDKWAAALRPVLARVLADDDAASRATTG